MNLLSWMKLILSLLLVLCLPACGPAALLPMVYTTMAVSNATQLASVPLQYQAMSQGAAISNQVQANMQSQKARDEERLAMERERHEAWRERENSEAAPYKQLPSVGIKLPRSDNSENGIILEGIYPGSPAERAGLKAYDKIVEKNGQPVNTIAQLKSQRLKIGDSVEYKIIRDGREMVFSMRAVPLGDILKAKE